MQFSTLAALFAAAGLVAAQSANHMIMVGLNGTKTYTPANITAAVGDTVTFVFMAGNHTVTQSSFAEPCVQAVNATTGQVGFDTDFQFVNLSSGSVPSVTVQVNSATPIWFYCRQNGHCGQGMVGAINANESSAKSFEAFKASAISINGTGAAAPAASGSSVSPLISSGTLPVPTSTASGAAASQTKNAAMGDKVKGVGALLAAVGVAAAVLL